MSWKLEMELGQIEEEREAERIAAFEAAAKTTKLATDAADLMRLRIRKSCRACEGYQVEAPRGFTVRCGICGSEYR